MEFRFFEIYRNAEYLELLLEGTLRSALLSAGAGLIGLAAAILLSASRYFHVPVLAHVSAAFVEFIRNTPLIVQLFFVAFGLPMLFGYQWNFTAHALLALTINFSAYFAEILRAGYGSVPEGQIEAATALGVRKRLIFIKIVLPQAIGKMYASLNSQFIFLFLTTGIISEIGVRDLTYAGLYIDSRTFRSFEVFIVLTIIYLLTAFAFKGLLNVIYRTMFKWRATA